MVYGDGLKYMSMHFHLLQQCSVHESGRGSNPRSVIFLPCGTPAPWLRAICSTVVILIFGLAKLAFSLMAVQFVALIAFG